MEKVKFHTRAWMCPECEEWHRLVKANGDGEYNRKCRCGFAVTISVKLVRKEYLETEIIAVEAK